MMATKKPDQMPHLAGTLERAQRLARPYGLLADGAQRLPGDTGESLLASLMVELDETILPRRFNLVTDTGRSVGLRVAGRRLLRIEPEAREPGETQPDTAATMLGQLQQILRGATAASLCGLRIDRTSPGSDPGIAISSIVAAGGWFQSEPTAPDPVPDLFNALSGRITAWLMLDPSGNKSKQGGDSVQLRRLGTLVREGLEGIEIQMANSLADPKDPGCVLLSCGGNNGLTLVYARSQYGGMLALLPTSEISCVLPAWRAFYHGG